MTQTTNYNLNKPGQEDFYNIDDFNENAEIIDGALAGKVTKSGDTMEGELSTPQITVGERIGEASPWPALSVGDYNFVYGKGAVALGRQNIACPGYVYSIKSDAATSTITLEKEPSVPVTVGQKVILNISAINRIPAEAEVLAVDETGKILTLSEFSGSYSKVFVPAQMTASNRSFYSAHAEGVKTVACGTTHAAHAEGFCTVASGSDSHAEGSSTVASGGSSHAEGSSTVASATTAHAEGRATIASNLYSHAEGQKTIAAGRSQHVEGEYNLEDESNSGTRGAYVHIVGNGMDENSRSNAHTLDWEGNAWFAGEVTVGAESTPLAASIARLGERVTELEAKLSGNA